MSRALTIAEATNELAFLVTGAYGKPVAKSMGAPLRLHLPWKYGFKSIKSIVRFTFTDERPVSFWEQLGRQRVRLLGQRQSRGAASALEPGDGARHHHQRVDPDAALQRLCRVRRRALYRARPTSRFTCEAPPLHLRPGPFRSRGDARHADASLLVLARSRLGDGPAVRGRGAVRTASPSTSRSKLAEARVVFNLDHPVFEGDEPTGLEFLKVMTERFRPGRDEGRDRRDLPRRLRLHAPR